MALLNNTTLGLISKHLFLTGTPRAGCASAAARKDAHRSPLTALRRFSHVGSHRVGFGRSGAGVGLAAALDFRA
jgi:hypothetical protein